METTSIQLGSTLFDLHLQEVQFIVIFGGMVLVLLIEEMVQGRSSRDIRPSRWLGNISLALFNHFLIIFYSIIVIGVLSRFAPDSPMLRYFGIADIPSFIIIVLVMEFVMYWVHRLFHHVPVLWRIHVVHHTDTEFDVTTSHRHHPFELMISLLLLTPIIFILGAPLIVMAAYTLLQTAFSLFSHSNIALPNKLDNVLRLFLVTPDFHRMHHSSDQRFTDSNYSAILPWFDYLFTTATQKPYDKLADMELGIEKLRDSKDNRLDGFDW